jgi:hypothetical protein
LLSQGRIVAGAANFHIPGNFHPISGVQLDYEGITSSIPGMTPKRTIEPLHTPVIPRTEAIPKRFDPLKNRAQTFDQITAMDKSIQFRRHLPRIVDQRSLILSMQRRGTCRTGRLRR